jgi:hypothetical protein
MEQLENYRIFLANIDCAKQLNLLVLIQISGVSLKKKKTTTT